mgnify:CR=1 FL=1
MTRAERAEYQGLMASATLYLKGLATRVEHIPSPVPWTASSVRRMRQLQGGGPVSVYVSRARPDADVCVLLVEGDG